MNDSEQKIRELQNKLDEVKRDFDRYKSETKSKMDRLERVLANHQHAGNDGSNFIYNDTTHVKPQQQFITGKAAFVEVPTGAATRSVAAIVTGEDSDAGDGIDNAQANLDYDNETKLTIFSAFGGKIVTGEGQTILGSSIVTVNEKIPGDLTGYKITVTDSEGTTFGSTVVSNTSNSITMTDESTFSSGNIVFFSFTPAFLGFSNLPWQTLYVLDTESGGIRFGFGVTGDGTNGRLFMDTDGRCKFRRPDGNIDIM